jgi:hypothetical protein
MTGDQFREQKVRLRIELEDAEKDLQTCRRVAESHGDLLIELGSILRNKPETFFRHGYSSHYGHPIESLHVINDRMVNAVNIQKMIDETNAVRAGAEKLSAIQEQLDRLETH